MMPCRRVNTCAQLLAGKHRHFDSFDPCDAGSFGGELSPQLFDLELGLLPVPRRGRGRALGVLELATQSLNIDRSPRGGGMAARSRLRRGAGVEGPAAAHGDVLGHAKPLR